jgi:hypothetical protein
MRAGYDRVHADTRRPPIPDLPIEPEKNAEDGGGALAVMLGVLIFLLLFAIGTALYARQIPPPFPQISRMEAVR